MSGLTPERLERARRKAATSPSLMTYAKLVVELDAALDAAEQEAAAAINAYTLKCEELESVEQERDRLRREWEATTLLPLGTRVVLPGRSEPEPLESGWWAVKDEPGVVPTARPRHQEDDGA